MVKTNQYQNPQRRSIITELKKNKQLRESGLWVQVANLLDKSRKNRRAVNLHKINKHTQAGDTVVVPGKVLGEGLLEHGVNIAAYKFSKGAKDKIKASGGKTLGLMDLAETNPVGKNIKIIG